MDQAARAAPEETAKLVASARTVSDDGTVTYSDIPETNTSRWGGKAYAGALTTSYVASALKDLENVQKVAKINHPDDIVSFKEEVELKSVAILKSVPEDVRTRLEPIVGDMNSINEASIKAATQNTIDAGFAEDFSYFYNVEKDNITHKLHAIVIAQKKDNKGAKI